MKAIYINLDPYLAAFAAWIKGGKSGTAPTFDPLPLAVTVPLGEDVAIFCPGDIETATATYSVGDVEMSAQCDGIYNTTDGSADWVARDVVVPLSQYAAGSLGQKYGVASVTGNVNIGVYIQYDGDDLALISFPVIVRREQASGPVDLVDFTPPLSLAGVSFAGVDIEGAEFDGNEIVAAADTGALSAPAGA